MTKIPKPPEYDQDDIEDYILKYADKIEVRLEIDGKKHKTYLTQLPVKEALRFVINWLRKGRITSRLTKGQLKQGDQAYD